MKEIVMRVTSLDFHGKLYFGRPLVLLMLLWHAVAWRGTSSKSRNSGI